MMFFQIHEDIVECGQLVGGENGIGTTFSAIRILKDKFIFAHVGDSLIYHNRGQVFKNLQVSHSRRRIN